MYNETKKRILFILNEASIGDVIKMIDVEDDFCILESIVERLRMEANTDEVKKNLKKLSKSNYWGIRGFVVEVATFDILCEMAEIEDNIVISDAILERLKKEFDIEVLKKGKKNVIKLSKARSFVIRKYVAEIAEVDVIMNMAEREDMPYVMSVILKRLEKEVDAKTFNKILKELSKSCWWRIRVLVAQVAPIDIITEMEKNEYNPNVLKVINIRLKLNSDAQ